MLQTQFLKIMATTYSTFVAGYTVVGLQWKIKMHTPLQKSGKSFSFFNGLSLSVSFNCHGDFYLLLVSYWPRHGENGGTRADHHRCQDPGLWQSGAERACLTSTLPMLHQVSTWPTSHKKVKRWGSRVAE